MAKDVALHRVEAHSENVRGLREITQRQRVIRTKPVQPGIYLRMSKNLRARAGPNSGGYRWFLELAPEHARCGPSTKGSAAR